jgi:tRNA(adenine34) deaminase
MNDLYWLTHALNLAKQAEQLDEVPVGAVVVLDNKIIGEGFNQPIRTNDPTAHAEVIALRAASKAVDNYRLINSTLYVTLEPCLMCAGAIIHARVKRLVYGAYDPKSGAITSVFNVMEKGLLNHTVDCEGGVLEQECGEVLRSFFKSKRV